MGPSGSGKTSLLDALAGRRGNIKHGVFTGDICINDQPVTPRQIQCVSSFVEQEDTFIGALTARETLEIAANLSLPRYFAPRSLIRLKLISQDSIGGRTKEESGGASPSFWSSKSS